MSNASSQEPPGALPRSVGALRRLKMDTCSAMASGVAHDLNNHLAAIQGNSAILRRRIGENADLDVHLDCIEDATRLSLELAEQLALYAGRFELEPAQLDMRTFLNETDLMLPPGAACEIEVGEPSPVFNADPALLAVALRGLVKNAAEAMAGMDARIRIRGGRADGEAETDERTGTPYFDFPRRQGDHVFVEVADKGPGCSPHVLDRMFDPFFSTKIRGRGMGLPVVAGIARGHGGSVAVRTCAPAGLAVRMILPVDPPDGL